MFELVIMSLQHLLSKMCFSEHTTSPVEIILRSPVSCSFMESLPRVGGYSAFRNHVSIIHELFFTIKWALSAEKHEAWDKGLLQVKGLE